MATKRKRVYLISFLEPSLSFFGKARFKDGDDPAEREDLAGRNYAPGIPAHMNVAGESFATFAQGTEVYSQILLAMEVAPGPTIVKSAIDNDKFGVALGILSPIPGADEIKNYRLIGRAFQESLTSRLGIVENTTRLYDKGFSTSYRVPGLLDKATKFLGEVKNAKEVEFRGNVKDFINYAKKNNFT